MKKVLKIILIVLAVLIVAAGGFLLYLTITEYRPAPVEPLEITGESGGEPLDPSEVTLVTWNLGFGALSRQADFVLDGGKGVWTAEKTDVEANLEGIRSTLDSIPADIRLFQETDYDSDRSFRQDMGEWTKLSRSAMALNYCCDYVPFPWPPQGRVRSGLMITTDHAMENARRIDLPCPFKWPVRIANLKRCLLVTEFPLKDTEKKLVLIDLHLEAYDNTGGREAQTTEAFRFMQEEYAKGNYVIVGGDFNQSFPNDAAFPVPTDPKLWKPGTLADFPLPEGWRYANDRNKATCRSLNQPYDPTDAETYHFIIDGFLLSPNVELKTVETVEAGFAYSDHNPVRMTVCLKGE